MTKNANYLYFRSLGNISYFSYTLVSSHAISHLYFRVLPGAGRFFSNLRLVPRLRDRCYWDKPKAQLCYEKWCSRGFTWLWFWTARKFPATVDGVSGDDRNTEICKEVDFCNYPGNFYSDIIFLISSISSWYLCFFRRDTLPFTSCCSRTNILW